MLRQARTPIPLPQQSHIDGHVPLPCRSPAGGCRRAAVAATLTILLAGGARADTQDLLLALQVNGYSIAKIGEFVLRDGVLLARRNELGDLGFKVPPARLFPTPEVNSLIPLSTLPGVMARLDLASQTLFVTATNDSLLPALLQAGGSPDRGGKVESGTGVTLNYDINGTSAGGRNVATGLLDVRAFSPWGVLSSDALVYAGGGPDGPGSYSAVRLDSTYTLSEPDSLRRYRAGDFITDSLTWTRPIRLGGLQITSDFGLRPDLVTFPLPTITGSAAVPSTVDVLVNGSRLLSRQVAAGPFQIPQLPVVTGAGTVSLSVTNALGQQVVVTQPFYASSALLAPGLQSYSAQFGPIRRNWGVDSDDYGGMAGMATYRRGVSSMLTLEANVEATNGVVKGGGGLVLNLDDFAVLNASAAGSTGGGGLGKQFSVGLQRLGTTFSVGASAIMSDRHFRDVASMNGDPVPSLQLNANIGLSLRRFGSVGVAYSKVDTSTAPAPVKVFLPLDTTLVTGGSQTSGYSYFQPAQHAELVAASYSVQVHNVSISVTAFRDFANSHSSGALISFTIPFGARSSGSVSGGSGSSGRSAQLQAQQSTVETGDWGYQAYAAAGTTAHQFGQVEYKASAALLSAGIDRVDKQITKTVEAQGALSFVDDALFASNAIDDSFAVVDTNGLANVRVLNENRLVGATDSAGQLLVPNLRSFDVNKIAIEPNDIPQDATIDTTTRIVRPQDRSGVVVRFPLKISRSALLHLVDEAGAAVPLGSTATLRSSGVAVPVGYDGGAFLQDLEPHNELIVERPDGDRCGVAFDYRPTPGQIPRIGPLRCDELPSSGR